MFLACEQLSCVAAEARSIDEQSRVLMNKSFISLKVQSSNAANETVVSYKTKERDCPLIPRNTYLSINHFPACLDAKFGLVLSSTCWDRQLEIKDQISSL